MPGSSASTPDRAEQDRTLQTGAGLLDRSERGRLALTGPDAKAFLNGQVSNDIERLTPGEGLLATFLTPKGKMLGDVRVLDADGDLLLDTERVSLQALFDRLRLTTIGHDVQLHKRTLQTAQLSLVGPAARTVAGVLDLPDVEHASRIHAIDGVAVRTVATYLGVDVLCPAEDAGRAHAALVAHGAVPVEEAAVEVLRVEAGRPRYGVDLDEHTMPEEAGLVDHAVSFTKGCYVGQETVARLHWRGKPNRHLRGLVLTDAVPPGTLLRLGDREVGTITSPVRSPRRGDIALALVRREAEIGAVLDAGDDGTLATVVPLPF